MFCESIVIEATTQLRSCGLAQPRREAELIVAHVLNCQPIDLLKKNNTHLSAATIKKIKTCLQQRTKGQPLAYIVGYKYFYKHKFYVNPHVLIPRPETEILVDEALKFINTNELRLIDLGTGSGCMGLSLLKEQPTLQLLAVDVCPQALQVARYNAQHMFNTSTPGAAAYKLSNAPQQNIYFIQKDAAQLQARDLPPHWKGQCDLIVANPPYVDKKNTCTQKQVVQYEPHKALFAKHEGLEYIQAWSQTAQRLLRPGGAWIFEMAYHHSPHLPQLFANLKSLTWHSTLKDLAGHKRVALAIQKSDA